MKVVHVIVGLGDGGAEGAMFRLISATREHEHIVVSLTTEGRYGKPLRDAGIETMCLNLGKSASAVFVLPRLMKIIRTCQPDIVQTWMYHADLIGGLAGRLAGAKIVWGIRHGNLSSGSVSLSTRIVAQLCAMLSYVVPSRIICCSRRAMETHQAVGYRSKIFKVIPNGYELSVLKRDEAAGKALRAELSIGPSTALLGMVARHDPQKDHSNLLSALQLVRGSGRQFVCLLVGTGMEPANDLLASEIASKGLVAHVRLLGQRKDIAAVMSALDLHVLSSAGEAFPNVLCEAMACETPCVSTDAGDAGFIVGDHGWIVPTRNPTALARAIEEAIDQSMDASRWREKGTSARNSILARFDISGMADSYNQTWLAADASR